ncbi:hydroxypyruvate isomerase family protein [Oleiharenicola lentus]|uniref:hydroxypyruvate isomerase family protein n=1 Tax=Oleiharenicola lentus TaxID=2508720 RepID=UPI003F680404
MKSQFTRREALQTLAGGLALAALPGVSSGQTPQASMPTLSSSGFRHSVCKWCYKDIPLADLADVAKDIGLSSIELLNPDEWAVVQARGLTCAIANGTTTIVKGMNRLEHHDAYVESMIARINQCADASIPAVILFSGNRDGMSDEQGLENCAIGLKRIVGHAEKRGVNVIMELLNSKVNHKDYMCDRTPWGVELVKRVGSERFKLLYDIYHMQIMEGDVIRTIQESHAYIGHYHTGGNPGRAEIDETQELYYPAIMRAIKATGYTGFVGQEFVPKKKPALDSLRAAVKLCSV